MREIFLVPNLMFLCVIVMELKSQGIFVMFLCVVVMELKSQGIVVLHYKV